MLEGVRRRLVRENRIYIMPSPRGFLFLGAVVVMILTAATYGNNLIFILAFILFALFVVSMLQTHYNLKGARLEFAGADEAFEGEPQSLLFHLTQKRSRLKRGLEIRTRSKTFRTLSERREDILPEEQVKAARIEVLAWRRGVHALPEVILETYFPLGMFRAWKIFRPQGTLIVYPRPEGDVKLTSVHSEHGEEETGLRTTPDGDFGELKNYQVGESYHQIAWKHYARTGDLYSKVHWGAEHKHYDLKWSPGRDPEQYLRQLSRWVMNALEEDASFELETPDSKVEPGRGMEQAKACWRALAAVPRQQGKSA
ncbi:MAG: DUF58 domain-containing protein [Bdellovibrionales bacterium]|nr:DUF58 domain-containing protein [Bdellovibrionales bacterium]